MPTNAQRMMELFRGNDQAYGTHGEPQLDDTRTKYTIKDTARTINAPLTVRQWEDHLEGKAPLGVIPLTMENEVYWGAIDVDVYDLDHVELVETIERQKLPLVTFISKSGGAHCYIFLSEPMAAKDLRYILREISAGIGYGGVEIFPKQDVLLVDRGDMGNWINMPYLGDTAWESTPRYALSDTGMKMSLKQFISHAEERRITPAQALELVVTQEDRQDPMSGGPPCLQHLAKHGFPAGTRNNGLFGMGTFLKKKYPGNWKQHLEEMNAKFFQPPLPTEEVSAVIKSLDAKDYAYKCNDTPLCNHCNASVCRTRRYGVGDKSKIPVMEGLTKIDSRPPVYFLTVDGKRIEFMATDLMRRDAFALRIMEEADMVMPEMSNHQHKELIGGMMPNMVLVEASDDVGIPGEFKEILSDFCTSKFQAETKEEITTGKPFREDNRIYFRLKDLMDEMKRAKFSAWNRTQITRRVKEMGGDRDFFNLRGAGVNVWWVPSTIFEEYTEPVPVRPTEGEVI